MSTILDIATSLISERGYDRVTVVDIARLAGVQSGAVYWYFPSKDHVLAAVMERALHDELDRLDRLPSSLTAMDRLMQYMNDLRILREMHLACHDRMYTSEPVAAVHEELMQQMRRLIDAALAAELPCDRVLAVDTVLYAFEGACVSRGKAISVVQLMLALVHTAAQAEWENFPAITGPIANPDELAG